MNDLHKNLQESEKQGDREVTGREAGRGTENRGWMREQSWKEALRARESDMEDTLRYQTAERQVISQHYYSVITVAQNCHFAHINLAAASS